MIVARFARFAARLRCNERYQNIEILEREDPRKTRENATGLVDEERNTHANQINKSAEDRSRWRY